MPSSQTSLATLRAECVHEYQWPDEIKSVLREEINGFRFDREGLYQLASRSSGTDHFALTVLSREYLQLGLAWAKFALQAGVTQFAIAAVDCETVAALKAGGIPHIKVELPTRLAGMMHYQNRGGFNGKALAIIYSRLQLVKFLVEQRINVLACDVDALIMKNPQPFLRGGSDIAFQRVVYFPKPLAKVWGFTACAGFVGFRASTRVADLLRRVLEIQQDISSDQLALNLALLECEVHWLTNQKMTSTDEDLMSQFAANAAQSIYGRTRHLDLALEALPATTFWRHDFIPLDRRSSLVLHPNSPKSLDGKLQVFRKSLTPLEMSNLETPYIKSSMQDSPHTMSRAFRKEHKWNVWRPSKTPLPKLPSAFRSISFCITCMGRAHDLKETIVQNIRDNEEYPYLEFVVLNYNSRDDMHSFMTSKVMSQYIESGRVKYLRTRSPNYYSSAHSHNIAFKNAKGEIVTSVDADNFTGKGFASYLNRLADVCPKRAFFARGKMRIHGRIGMYKAEFEELGGYDEDLIGYGFDDHSLMLRAMNTGFTLMWWARGARVDFAKRIKTPRNRVAENMQNSNWRETESINKKLTLEKLERGELVVNVNRAWGRVEDLEVFA